jgi:hypothetical protein
MGNWDPRFHVSPSQHNPKTSIYYKQFFDKPTKFNESRALKPRKTLDPYEEIEFKSRLPAYSKVYSKQARTKELGWVDNFSVTCSKDNGRVHSSFKEFFDQPRGYEGTTTVGKTRGVTRKMTQNQKRESLYTNYGYMYQKEPVFKTKKKITQSVERATDSPFLRDPAYPNVIKRFKGCAPKRQPFLRARVRKAKTIQRFKKREGGWAEVGKPISAYNEAMHKSLKLGFSDL